MTYLSTVSVEKKTRKQWTKEENFLFAALYPHSSSLAIARLFGVTERRVQQHAWVLGIKKSKIHLSWLFKKHAERMNANPDCRHFRCGNVPWNKGRKGLNGKSDTVFKPGNIPHTTLPIGTERVGKGNYLRRKVRNNRWADDWMWVHHIVWLEAGRTIPDGSILIFKDGDKRNFALDNLQCVTKEEHLLRNTVGKYGPEVQELYFLLGKINKTVNRRINGEDNRRSAQRAVSDAGRTDGQGESAGC